MKKILLTLLFLIPLISFADNGLWFQANSVTRAYYGGDWEKPSPSQAKVHIYLEDPIFEGIVMVYAKRVITLTLRKKLKIEKNREGSIYQWTFMDDCEDYGICKLYVNNNNTYQILIIYDKGFSVCYDMSPLVR